MSQIVKPESEGELCPSENWLKVAAYKIPKNYRRTLTRRKNQFIVLVVRTFLQSAFCLFPSMIREFSHKRSRYRYRSPTARSLSFTEIPAATLSPDKCSPYCCGSGVKVKIRPFQREIFFWSHSGCDRKREHDAEFVFPCSLKKTARLFRR